MSKISDEAYEELKQILEKQYEQAFKIKDLKEIGESLLDFYETIIKFDPEQKEDSMTEYL